MEQPIKVLAVRENKANEAKGYGASQVLQCFTGGVEGVVGEIRNYDMEKQVKPGDYMATFGWSNYQGKLTPRVTKLEPMGANKP